MEQVTGCHHFKSSILCRLDSYSHAWCGILRVSDCVDLRLVMVCSMYLSYGKLWDSRTLSALGYAQGLQPPMRTQVQHCKCMTDQDRLDAD